MQEWLVLMKYFISGSCATQIMDYLTFLVITFQFIDDSEIKLRDFQIVVIHEVLKICMIQELY